MVQVEYPQDWLTTKLEDTGQKQAAWRTDPAQSGAGGAIGDIGSHAYNLAGFITGLRRSRCAPTSPPSSPAAGSTTTATCCCATPAARAACSGPARSRPATRTRSQIRVYGERGGLEWHQERPDRLQLFPFGKPPQVISRAGPGAGAAAAKVSRIPPGHVEGYLEAFANIYTGCAELIAAKLEGREPDPDARLVPGVEDGARGVKFITAAVESSSRGGVWTDLHLAL